MIRCLSLMNICGIYADRRSESDIKPICNDFRRCCRYVQITAEQLQVKELAEEAGYLLYAAENEAG